MDVAAAYVNRYEGCEKDKCADIFLRYHPAEVEKMLSEFNVTGIAHIPTDGKVFGKLNDMAEDEPYELDKLHAWLNRNQSVFENPDWIKKSIHALYVRKKL